MSDELRAIELLPERQAYEPWDDAQDQWLKRLWKDGGTITSIARDMGTTRGSISGRAMRLHLHFNASERRLGVKSLEAIAAGHTIFTGKVQDPGIHGVLKPGHHQRKLGTRVLKGRWKGMPIYSLTLEERATCPTSCLVWKKCYGNHMGHAVRYRHGPLLEAAIFEDLMMLERRHPNGFVVRLHILGEFMSVQYVQFWADCLDQFPGLRVFGYSARQLDDPIGAAIAFLRDERWDRFAVRTSGAPTGPRTMVIDAGARPPDRAIICPAQTEKTSHCGACALCWAHPARERPIAFRSH